MTEFLRECARLLDERREELDRAMWFWSREGFEAMAPIREGLRDGSIPLARARAIVDLAASP